jgi:enoyl-CoA hydratase/carnithine racemase
MNYDLIQLAVADGVATITLNRPDKRNAMSDDMRAQFVHALEHVATEKSIGALVLTGSGKGFCAGGDIAGMEKRLNEPQGEIAHNGWKRQLRVHHAVSALFRMPKPTIAAVNGAAAGLGADTALACDFVVASEASSFTWSYVLRGLIPDGGGMYFLPRRVGLSKAKDLIFSGRTVNADEALRIGVADRLVAPERLLPEAQEWAAQLAKNSPTAIGLSKAILDQTFEQSAEQIFAQGSQAQGICYTSAEHRESVAAFLKRSAERK